MDDIRKLRQNADARNGHFRLEAMIPVTKVINWLKNRIPRKEKMVWIYDGCDCTPTDGARSVPYCTDHWNPLIRKEILS